MSTTNACFTIGPATPQTASGALYLRLAFTFTTANTQDISLYSVTLTLTPITAGAAEEPVPSGRSGEGEGDR